MARQDQNHFKISCLHCKNCNLKQVIVEQIVSPSFQNNFKFWGTAVYREFLFVLPSIPSDYFKWITPPARKVEEFEIRLVSGFFFSVSKVGQLLMGDTAGMPCEPI